MSRVLARGRFGADGPFERQVDRRDGRARARIDVQGHVPFAVGGAHVGPHDRREVAVGRNQIARPLRTGSDEKLELIVGDVVALGETHEIEMLLEQLADRARSIDGDVVLRGSRSRQHEKKPGDGGGKPAVHAARGRREWRRGHERRGLPENGASARQIDP